MKKNSETTPTFFSMNMMLRDICTKYVSLDKYLEIKENYNRPNRHYHNWKHVIHVAQHLYVNCRASGATGGDTELMLVAAFLHDAVYEPTSHTNEADSAMLLEHFDMGDRELEIIKRVIEFTTYKNKPADWYEKTFMEADLAIFNASLSAQLEFERAIFREYYFVPIPVYVTHRTRILKDLKQRYGCNTDFLVNYLETKKWNVGLYAGTFYPFSVGHNSVAEQAAPMFDKIIVAFGKPGDKTSFKWDTEKYGVLNEYVYNNYETVEIKELITMNIEDIRQYATVTLIRGLRNGSDLIYEQNYLQALRDIDPLSTAAYFMTEPSLAHVSSSLIRDLLKHSPENAYKYYKI